MIRRKSVAIAVALLFGGAVAWACGPMFPSQLLDDRASTLKTVPQNTFAFEAQHLLPATDKLVAVEDAPYRFNDAKPPAMPDLTPAQEERVKTLRQSESGAASMKDSGDLPADVRGYVAGAIDYRLGVGECSGVTPTPVEGTDTEDQASPRRVCHLGDTDALDQAQTTFETVVAMPADSSMLRGVWAAYMLGEIHALRAVRAEEIEDFAKERDAAAKAFGEARSRAVAGGSDNQGLAVASFGEEARLYLVVKGEPCEWADLYNDKPCAKALAPADIKHAIALYAAQAGHGSDNAVQSLATIADVVLKSPEQTSAIIDGPVSQRLLVAYALARIDGSTDGKPDERLGRLVDGIEKAGLDKVSAADRLASLAYQLGRYDLAAQLVSKAPGPLSSWVSAKLALQKGDMAAATAAYAQAAKAFPTAYDPKTPLDQESMHLLMGEQGVLALARGEYVEAMGHMYDTGMAVGGDGNVVDDYGSGYGYGNDTAYIAERVLTVDELKTFVDARAPASPVKAVDPNDKEAAYRPMPLNDRLRWLLARRLVRAGRYADAEPYFVAGIDKRFAEVDLRETVRAYAKALHDGDHAWTDIGKAEALFTAATIARVHGMEIMGYEQDPDYTDIGGGYEGGSGQSAASLKGAYVTEGERHRFDESMAKPYQRFHYRYTAVDQASLAADMLPPRSQAFAAVLCKATGWMEDGPGGFYMSDDAGMPVPNERSKRIEALYSRYVKQGPYVEWADDFGRTCEEPNFDSARKLLRAQRIAAVKHAIRHYLPYEIAGFVAIVGLVGFAIRRRRRKA
ncbi:hypothetical protein EC912_103364 [Luteibacter rhizovicinus]|uniref:Tetratricopeptide repeat protein n=1 Tax=Luteibacter rhizovicinus TaxID=242606 RepID=A0A4R3YPP6_9GAMM|nr:hypothetical protein [Luteibacter rhizovicinus]TCV94875.1 hypothetical protein EC912_103364 [Luteibacter rhizovicinus]